MTPEQQLQELADLEELCALEDQKFKERCEQSLEFFFANVVWPVLKPSTKLVWTWALNVLSLYGVACLEGKCPRWICNVSVRCGKSLMLSVALPCWWWIKHPTYTFAFQSHSDKLESELQEYRKAIINSEIFRKHWGDVVRLPSRSNQNRVRNTAGGVFLLLGTAPTGSGGACVIIDDPSSTDQASSSKKLARKNDAIRDGTLTRLNDRRGPTIVIQQRQNPDDLSGVLTGMHGWVTTSIPIHFEEDTVIQLPEGKSLKIAAGTFMDPERFGPEKLAEMKQSMTEQGYKASMLQRPYAGALVVRAETIKPYDIQDRNWRQGFTQMTLSIDSASKEEAKGHSRWGILCWGAFVHRGVYLQDGVKKISYDSRHFLWDMATKHMDYPNAKGVILRLVATHQVTDVWIENAQNGPSLASELQRAGVPGVRLITPARIAKPDRLEASTLLMELGRVYVPTTEWGRTFTKELTKCTAKLNERDPAWDNADACSLYLNEIQNHPGLNTISHLAGISELESVTGIKREITEEPWPLGYDAFCPQGYKHVYDLKRASVAVSQGREAELTGPKTYVMLDPTGALWDVTDDEVDKLLQEGWRYEVQETRTTYA